MQPRRVWEREGSVTPARAKVRRVELVALFKRLFYILPVIWLVVSMVFLLIHLVPGDPVQQMLGEGATASDLSALRHQYGLDAPLSEQYIHYWRGVLHGDLGRSLRLNDSVSHLVLTRYPYTLELTVAALVLALAYWQSRLACWPRLRRAAMGRQCGRCGEPAGAFLSKLSRSARSSFCCFLSSWDGSPSPARVRLPTWYCPRSPWAAAWPPFLPGWSAPRCWRSLSQDYIRTARAKGLSEHAVVYRHALRNAIIPVMTLVGLQFGALLAGAIVTETIFSWPGIGRLTVSAISNRDYALVQGCILAVGSHLRPGQSANRLCYTRWPIRRIRS